MKASTTKKSSQIEEKSSLCDSKEKKKSYLFYCSWEARLYTIKKNPYCYKLKATEMKGETILHNSNGSILPFFIKRLSETGSSKL